MITVTRINDKPICVNADMIEFIETTPDTIITMTNGKKILVKDSIEELIEKVIHYKQRCLEHLKIEAKK